MLKTRVHAKKILIIGSLVILVVAVAVFFVINYNNQSDIKNNSEASTNTTKVDNQTENNPVANNTPIDNEPDTTPTDSEPAIICETNTATDAKFILVSDALVYNNSADAKSKSNPTGTYHAGEYSIFKCFNGMANITRTSGIPGGWIDPQDPYATSSVSTPIITTSVVADVMGLSNTIVNWSHEYPSTFVSKYNGYWNIPGNNLYLSFDCGYDYNNLASTIMDILSAKNIKAVFFVTGDFMNTRPDLIKRMLAEGHIVGNHSYAHLNQPQNLDTSTEIIMNDLEAWKDKYISIVGAEPSVYYFRPPAGAISERSMGLINELGYKTMMWGAAYNDWDTTAQPSQETAMDLLRKYTTPGDIILLHGISETSTSILSQYIDEYRNNGFEFKLF